MSFASESVGQYTDRYTGNGGSKSGYWYPFLDPSSRATPRSWREIYDWGRLVYYRSPEFVDAHRKLFSYFSTDLKVEAADSDNQEISNSEVRNWKEVMISNLGYPEQVAQLGISVALWGSQIVTLQARCDRMLVCPHPHCGAVFKMLDCAPKSEFDFKFDHGKNKFLFRCQAPGCPNRNARVPAVIKDWHRRSADDLYLKQWPPDEIDIDYYLWTERDEIYWRIPEYYKRSVRRGHLETLAEADLDVLEAIRQNRLFQFYRERVFHAKEMSIAGLGLRGRGVPRSLTAAPQIWSMQVLRHQNQVLSMDYLVPLGFFSLAENKQSGVFSGPDAGMDVGSFQRDMERVLSAHRRDPSQRFALNYAIRYQVAGGEAAQFAPVQLMEYGKNEIYDAAGVPLEMYRGSLNIQVMPVAARLFESSNQTIPALLNRFADFTARRVSEELSLPAASVSHEKSTVVADLTRQSILLQGRQIGDVSRATAYSGMDIDVDAERERRIQETLDDARGEMELNKTIEAESLDMNMRAMPAPIPNEQQPVDQNGQPVATMPPGMMPSQGMAPGGMSVEQMGAEAEQIASQLVDPSLPQSEVNRQLEMVRAQSQEMHSLVRAAMSKIRNEASSMGRDAVLSGQM